MTLTPPATSQGSPNAPERYRIAGFDGLRAIAVLLVFLHHRTTLSSLDLGSYGVWLFFVLSGFLIVDILRRARETIENGRVRFGPAWRQFAQRRALRIFPAYYLTLMILFAMTEASRSGPVMHWQGVVMNLDYMSNTWIAHITGHWMGWFSHLWSLSIEEQFYLMMPLIAFAVPSSRLVWVCAGLAVLGLVVEIALYLSHAPAISIYTDSTVNFGVIAFGGFCVLSRRDRAPGQGTNGFLAATCLVVYLTIPWLLHRIGLASHDRRFSPIVVLLAGLLLLEIVRNQRSWLVRVLEWPSLRYLGRISYGFYLFHPIATFALAVPLIHRLTGANPHLSPSAQLLVDFAMSLTAAALSWTFFERKFLDLRTAPAESREAVAPVTLSVLPAAQDR